MNLHRGHKLRLMLFQLSYHCFFWGAGSSPNACKRRPRRGLRSPQTFRESVDPSKKAPPLVCLLSRKVAMKVQQHRRLCGVGEPMFEFELIISRPTTKPKNPRWRLLGVCSWVLHRALELFARACLQQSQKSPPNLSRRRVFPFYLARTPKNDFQSLGDQHCFVPMALHIMSCRSCRAHLVIRVTFGANWGRAC